MAALLRCAARRLGGSLLQRTQTAERRQLFSPSRLMHTRDEHAREDLTREIQQKKKVMYDAISKWEKDSMSIGAAQHLPLLPCQSNNTLLERSKQELYDAMSKAKMMTLGCTYNVGGLNYRRLARFAKGVATTDMGAKSQTVDKDNQ